MYLGQTAIEIIHPDIERGRFRYVLLDFDGTISLIREGWQQVMLPMMVDTLARAPAPNPAPISSASSSSISPGRPAYRRSTR